MTDSFPGYHVPVMPSEVLENLITDKHGIYLDGTMGGGGHTALILKHLSAQGRMIGLDRDKDAIDICENQFAGEDRLEMHQTSFSNLESVCKGKKLSGALFDLGVSSHQLDEDSRGFSFEKSLPLDMRMNNDTGRTALKYLLKVPEKDLASALAGNSDMRKPRVIAKELKSMVKADSTTDLLHAVLDKVYPKGVPNRMSMLARLAQAIRMEVNEELCEIEKGLVSAVDHILPGGRICVISFHSVEDRMVKRVFNRYEHSCTCPREIPVCVCGNNHHLLKKVNKKPLLPSQKEIAMNKRSRSAKLRVVERMAA
jgi:16S rRNA (cytosine1402-N4)-methyltransferase